MSGTRYAVTVRPDAVLLPGSLANWLNSIHAPIYRAIYIGSKEFVVHDLLHLLLNAAITFASDTQRFSIPSIRLSIGLILFSLYLNTDIYNIYRFMRIRMHAP